MKLTILFTSISTLTFLFLLTTLAAPGIPSDYTTTRLLITGTTQDGTPLDHTGTKEEIPTQLTAQNPHFQTPHLSSLTKHTIPHIPRND
ncbi:hypothetical protein IFR05_016198, partial [Cadophora sp. M221]